MTRNKKIDPRIYQITVLTVLVIYGVIFLDFEISMGYTVTVLFSTLATQYFCSKIVGLSRFDIRSPLISGLSLCLLLRTNYLSLAALAGLITIASKFFIRWNGKHLYNPTNFGLVAMLLLSNKVWVSPGQWGSAAFFGFLLACLGGFVVNHSRRSDVTYAFLFGYIGLLFGRSFWLGDPISIPLHQIQNGAFLIFTFFMISDPKTTPDSRTGRILFAFLVAIGAFLTQYYFYHTNGLLWSLVLVGMITPLLDCFIPGVQYNWPRPKLKDKTNYLYLLQRFAAGRLNSKH